MKWLKTIIPAKALRRKGANLTTGTSKLVNSCFLTLVYFLDKRYSCISVI
jgi:hypothetical protein